jgi:hypothetical protein
MEGDGRAAMSPTLLKALIGLLLIGVLLFRSITSLVKEKSARAVIQSLGAAFLMVVVFAHICEALGFFPSMHWGVPHSAGHDLDFWSAVLGVSLFLVGYLLRARTKRQIEAQ